MEEGVWSFNCNRSQRLRRREAEGTLRDCEGGVHKRATMRTTPLKPYFGVLQKLWVLLHPVVRGKVRKRVSLQSDMESDGDSGFQAILSQLLSLLPTLERLSLSGLSPAASAALFEVRDLFWWAMGLHHGPRTSE